MGHEVANHVGVHLLKTLARIYRAGLANLLRRGGPRTQEAELQGVFVHAEFALLLRGVQHDRGAVAACAARAAGAVHVSIRVRGGARVHHEVHAGDVQAARSHVCRHQHVDVALLELANSGLARVLSYVTVQHLRLELTEGVAAHEVVCLPLCVGEHDSLPPRALGEDQVLDVGRYGLQTVCEVGQTNGVVLDSSGETHLTLLHGVQEHGVCHMLVGQLADPPRHGGAEQQHLHLIRIRYGGRAALLLVEEVILIIRASPLVLLLPVAVGQRGRSRCARLLTGCFYVQNDALYVLLEAHLQHRVSLVQHHVANTTQVDCTSGDVVQHAARSGYQDMHAGADGSLLHGERHSAEDGLHFHAVRGADGAQLLCHLHGQLSGGL
mmetsp:Transcript_29964/g.66288  ORF Transcript_29964/g.66288 Transcript_29964/m.66288 type:complete len:381 (-) Transcript_29964:384-1526(-)